MNASGGQAAGDDQPLVERALHVARAGLDGEGADDRGDDRDATEDQREIATAAVWLKVRTPSSITATAVTA